jgi:DMSO/TMAO reductase YedYZ molybdopterin-dependent catalytic subunit
VSPWALLFAPSASTEMRRLGLIVVGALAAAHASFAVVAQTPPASTLLSISGNVAEPLALTVDDLKRYPAQAVAYSPSGGTSSSTPSAPARHYTGVALRDVLNAAKPTEGKPRDLRRSYVVATASDGYEAVFSWGELFISPVGDSVFVVYERDGAPLADDEGRFALIAVNDLRPARHVKWLRRLTLRTAPES